MKYFNFDMKQKYIFHYNKTIVTRINENADHLNEKICVCG